MTNKNQLKNRLLFFAAILPIISIVISVGVWVDARYMHRSVSDIRNISLQIRIIEMRISDFEEKIDQDINLSATDRRKYKTLISELENLQEERKRMLGITDD